MLAMGTRQAKPGKAARSRADGSSLGQPYSTGQQKMYMEFTHFEMEVMNILLRRHYDISDAERVPIIET